MIKLLYNSLYHLSDIVDKLFLIMFFAINIELLLVFFPL